ncbi:MAG: sodium:glutamate symporter [Acidaminococcaceae bacterium]
MTVKTLLVDIQIISVFMILGFIAREVFKPFQRLYIPTSMLGGFLALIAGNQVLGLIDIPKSLATLPGNLIGIVLTCIVYGITFEKSRIRNYIDYTMVIISVYGAQLLVGVPLGIFLQKFWPTLPNGWGTMGVFSFWGGHGTASAAGATFDKLGIDGNFGLGMILSTIGLMAAVTVGIVMVNWGIRKGYAAYTKVPVKGVDDPTLCGVLPKEMQKPIGLAKTSSSGINALVFQLSMIMVCILVGSKILAALSLLAPFFGKVPALVHGMLGAAVVRLVMHKLHLTDFVDKGTVSSISGMTLDLVIISAVATIKLSLVTEFLFPIIIYSVVLLAITMWMAIYFCRKLCAHEWFEKACCLFGMASGAVPTGLALVRCVDPEGKSSAPDAQGVGSTLFTPVFGTAPAFIPILFTTSITSVLGIGAALCFLPLVVGYLLLRKRAA